MQLGHGFLLGYALSVLIEAPVLLVGLSARHSWRDRLFAGLWLTACTYPVVYLLLPAWIDIRVSRLLYLVVAETFAPVAECLLFWAVFGKRELWATRSMTRDFAVITLANLASFAGGELLYQAGWLGE